MQSDCSLYLLECSLTSHLETYVEEEQVPSLFLSLSLAGFFPGLSIHLSLPRMDMCIIQGLTDSAQWPSYCHRHPSNLLPANNAILHYKEIDASVLEINSIWSHRKDGTVTRFSFSCFLTKYLHFPTNFSFVIFLLPRHCSMHSHMLLEWNSLLLRHYSSSDIYADCRKRSHKHRSASCVLSVGRHLRLFVDSFPFFCY